MASNTGTNTNLMSLRDLIRYHRDAFVVPLFWTSRHLDLVGCYFKHINISGTAPSSRSKTTESESERPFSEWSDAELLAKRFLTLIKQDCIVSILVGPDRAFSSSAKGPAFFFGNRSVHKPRWTVFYPHSQSHQPSKTEDGQKPSTLVACAHYTHIMSDRSWRFRPREDPSGKPNRIGHGLARKKTDRVTPKEWTEDPYFVCHLLALAQLQEREWTTEKGPKPTSYTSRLIVTNALDHDYIHLFEAQISAELLQVLKEPESNAANDYVQWPSVLHKECTLHAI
ncbi:hypothetical protein BJX61DRAFT_547116 [Aspergillus egyptiacus]|nr:hypothetical protein BJX61DRAFT_547116 [Aspergillus egyptiacus]